MNTISAKPYKLYNIIQNYEWGTKNEQAFIPRFLGIEPLPNLPYAELWIGAHYKASSSIEINGKRIPLSDIIREFPIDCLGESVLSKYGAKLPFLLKILSAQSALSIQTHPNKTQAAKLHQINPQNYPDDNHKPEIAIAIDNLTALVGFKPVMSIQTSVAELPELMEFVDGNLVASVINSKNIEELGVLIRELYTSIMKSSENIDRLNKCITGIYERLKSKTKLLIEEEQFIIQYNKYGVDVGLFSFFFFNLVELQPGEAIFTDSGIPHAYLKGNIIECMANSDNVVRAGLTPKFKDVDTLLEIIKYDFENPPFVSKQLNSEDVIFKTNAKEFEVTALNSTNGKDIVVNNNFTPSVVLVMRGKVSIEWFGNDVEFEEFNQGESLFIPAKLSEYKMHLSANCQCILVKTS